MFYKVILKQILTFYMYVMIVMYYVSVNKPNMPCRVYPPPHHEHTSTIVNPYIRMCVWVLPYGAAL